MRAVYLTGDDVYLRAHVKADAECASAWYDKPLPLNSTGAETLLKAEHKDFWSKRRMRLAIARRSDDVVIGGAIITRRPRDGDIDLVMAPWVEDADRLRAQALRLLFTWLRDDLECLLIRAWVGADEPETGAAAEDLGMHPVVRLRRFLARPGRRVDLLVFEWADAQMEAVDA